jgi:glycosyltransferase involved in cell wall biosynthesis
MTAEAESRNGGIVHSLVIPVYRNEANIPALLAALAQLAAEIADFEVVFVVDGSPDRSAPLLQAGLKDAPYAWQLAELSRNFGSFAAIRQGLGLARSEFVAVMAADLQEPPELITRFFAELASGEVDVVVGTRSSRSDPALSSLSSRIFWALYRRLIMPQVPEGGVDVFACNAVFKRALLSLEERESFLIGQLFWVGFRRREIAYERREREVGKSAWTFRKKLSYMLDGIFAFSSLPISLLLWIGVLGTLVSTVSIAVVFASWLAGAIRVPGYAPIMLAISFFGSLTTLGMGTLGGYVWRIAENGRRRPLSLIMSHSVSEAAQPRQDDR